MSIEPDRIRALLISAPDTEARAVGAALARSGRRVETVTADDERSLLQGLRTPLDLVLAWHRSEPTDLGRAGDGGSGPPSLARTLDLILGLGLQIPVVGMIEPGTEDEVLDRLEGVDELIYRDRPAPLAAIARHIGAESRSRDLVEIARATCHDLNNLLAPVPLATRILRDQIGEHEDASFLETVEGSVARSTAAVGSLYRVALWSGGEAGPTAGPIQLRHLIEATARTVRDTFPGLAVETDYPSDLPPVDASPGTLRQILQCLALNAVGEGFLRRVGSADGATGGQDVKIVARSHRGSIPPREDREPGPSAIVISISGPSEEDPGDLATLRTDAALLGGTIEVASGEQPERLTLRLTLPWSGPTRPTRPGPP